MTYETKNITFHVIHVKVSSDSLNVQELHIWRLKSRVHVVIVREIRARIEFERICVESMVDMIKGRELYQSVKLSNLFRQKYA